MNRMIERVVVGALQENCYLYAVSDGEVQAGKSRPCVVVDPGDEAELIIARLKKLNWSPQYVLFTHGHYDHISALSGLLAACKNGEFGDCIPKIAIHKKDAHYLGKEALAAHRASLGVAGFAADFYIEPLPEPDILYGEGDTFETLTVLHTPGHTQGGVCLYDAEAGVLFTGDTLFKGDFGRTDLPGGDHNQLRESLKRLLALKGETVVYPGHEESTTIKGEAQLQF